jgi:hypothetical protein
MMSFRRESAIGFQGLLAQLILKSHYAESASLCKSRLKGGFTGCHSIAKTSQAEAKKEENRPSDEAF